MTSGPRVYGAAIEAVICHLTQPELAERWRISTRSLERWRDAGTGPAWLRLNGRVRYRLADVLAFEDRNHQRPAGSAGKP